MSIQKPGRNSVKVTSSRISVSWRRFLAMKKPCVAAANIMLATVALTMVITRWKVSVMPISRICVLKMNMKGSTAVRRL